MRALFIFLDCDEPYAGTKPQPDQFNFCLTCKNCEEFFALAVCAPGTDLQPPSKGDGLFDCPFCHHQQRCELSEINKIYFLKQFEKGQLHVFPVYLEQKRSPRNHGRLLDAP
jgi:hypothetical protein